MRGTTMRSQAKHHMTGAQKSMGKRWPMRLERWAGERPWSISVTSSQNNKTTLNILNQTECSTGMNSWEPNRGRRTWQQQEASEPSRLKEKMEEPGDCDKTRNHSGTSGQELEPHSCYQKCSGGKKRGREVPWFLPFFQFLVLTVSPTGQT